MVTALTEVGSWLSSPLCDELRFCLLSLPSVCILDEYIIAITHRHRKLDSGKVTSISDTWRPGKWPSRVNCTIYRLLAQVDNFRMADHSGVNQFGGGLRQCFRQLKLSLQAGRHSGTSGRWRS